MMKKLGCLLLTAALLLGCMSLSFAEETELLTNRDITEATLADCTLITLNGTTFETTAAGVSAADGVLTITMAGDYALTGSWTGRVAVALSTEGKVNLLLNGVDIQATNAAAMTIEGSSKTVMTLAEGTSNTLTYGTADEDITAALFSRDDLSINGTGTLTIQSAEDGIGSRDTLKIVNGTIVMTCGDDGLVGKDAVVLAGGNVTMTCEGDGVKATNDEDANRGYVAVTGGTLQITTGGGHGSAVHEENWGVGDRWDMMASTATEDAASAKGIKAVTSITISGGTMTMDCADDGIHAGTAVTVSGGDITIATGDDGLHCDADLTISGGNVTVTESYEGIEGTDIVISGGNISVKSSDDGINAAGGSDSDTTMGGWHGQDRFSSGTGTLTITGGYVVVDATGDGLDANGSVTMSGGEVYVAGPTSSGNGALDYDSTFDITGGTLVALDCGGMSQTVSSTTIPGATVNLSGSADFTVTDGTTTLIQFAAGKSYALAVVYSDKLTDGATYTMSSESASQSVAVSTTVTSTGGFGGFGGSFGGHGGGRR